MMNRILCIISATVLLLSGCAATENEIDAATSSCSTHGGIKYLYSFPWTELHCNDGVIFDTFVSTETRPLSGK